MWSGSSVESVQDFLIKLDIPLLCSSSTFAERVGQLLDYTCGVPRVKPCKSHQSHQNHEILTKDSSESHQRVIRESSLCTKYIAPPQCRMVPKHLGYSISLRFLKLDFIIFTNSISLRFLEIVFTFSLRFLKLVFISLRFLELAFIFL